MDAMRLVAAAVDTVDNCMALHKNVIVVYQLDSLRVPCRPSVDIAGSGIVTVSAEQMLGQHTNWPVDN